MNRDLVEQAGMRLISRLLRKDQSTMKVLKFLANLTDYAFLEKFVVRNKNVDLAEEKSRQTRLALFLLQELVKNPSGAVSDIPPVLNQLTINLDDKARFPRLLALAKKGMKVRYPITRSPTNITLVVRKRQGDAQTTRKVLQSASSQSSRG